MGKNFLGIFKNASSIIIKRQKGEKSGRKNRQSQEKKAGEITGKVYQIFFISRF
jgi:hypothetical protein